MNHKRQIINMSSILTTVSAAPLVAVPVSSSSGTSRFLRHSSYSFLRGKPLPGTPLLSPASVTEDGLFHLKRKPRYGFYPVHAKDVNAGQWDNGRQWLSHLTSVSLTEMVERWHTWVNDFPWPMAVGYFTQTILGLAIAVVKYLCVPVLALSSLSEMSYCAHERKMFFIPVSFLAGIAMATILKQTATDVSPDISESEYPWHLLLMALFFMLLKLPGPYYPYFGRLVIPHFANGGLCSTLWFIFWWYSDREMKESSP